MKIPMENLPYINHQRMYINSNTQRYSHAPFLFSHIESLLPYNMPAFYQAHTHTIGYSLDCAPLFSRIANVFVHHTHTAIYSNFSVMYISLSGRLCVCAYVLCIEGIFFC